MLHTHFGAPFSMISSVEENAVAGKSFPEYPAVDLPWGPRFFKRHRGGGGTRPLVYADAYRDDAKRRVRLVRCRYRPARSQAYLSFSSRRFARAYLETSDTQRRKRALSQGPR